MPVDLLDEAVDVLLELPGQATLADPRRPGDGDESRAPFRARGVDHVLQQAQLDLTPHERRLEALTSATPALVGHHAQCAPSRHGGGLALQHLFAGRLEGDGACRGLHRRFPHQHRVGRRHGLQAGGGVDQVARDHALVGGAEGHGGLAGQDPHTSAQPLVELADGVHDLQRGPHRALGIILIGALGAPGRHHSIADELLHLPAVTLDHGARGLEVTSQRLTHELRVSPLGVLGEGDEIGEEHRDETTLRGVLAPDRYGSGRSRALRCGIATVAESHAAVTAEARLGPVLRSAGRADVDEAGAALIAETSSSRIVGGATPTGDDDRPPRYPIGTRSVAEHDE